MKTLKQQLQEYFDEIETVNIIAYVEKWLEQKRQEMNNDKWCDKECTETCIECVFIGLLEELKQ